MYKLLFFFQHKQFIYLFKKKYRGLAIIFRKIGDTPDNLCL